jgi:hypothetical protein
MVMMVWCHDRRPIRSEMVAGLEEGCDVGIRVQELIWGAVRVDKCSIDSMEVFPSFRFGTVRQ